VGGLAPSHRGSRLGVGVGLARDLHDLIGPVVGQGVRQLGLGEALGDIALDVLPNLSHGQGLVSQGEDAEDDGLGILIQRGLFGLDLVALVNLGVQVSHHGLIGIAVVGQGIVHSGQSGNLHRAHPFWFGWVFLPDRFRVPSWNIFIVPHPVVFVKGFSEEILRSSLRPTR